MAHRFYHEPLNYNMFLNPFFQWTLLGLNQRPSDYESDALTN